MKFRQKKLLFLYALCFILLITGFLGTLTTKDGRNTIMHETALLNPRYEPLVDNIELSLGNTEELLTFVVQDNGVIGNYLGISFPVNVSKILEFISVASISQQVEFITDDAINFETYGVTEASEDMKKVTFSGLENENKKDFSTLFFGAIDYTGTKRYVRASHLTSVYAFPDRYYAFLQTSPSAWVDPKIIPDILKNGNLDTNIASLRFSDGDKEIVLFSGDNFFGENVHIMVSLQSANVLDAQKYIGLEADYIITVTYFNGYSVSCNIYQNELNYVVVPNSPQLLYGIEISQWSFEKLHNIFID